MGILYLLKISDEASIKLIRIGNEGSMSTLSKTSIAIGLIILSVFSYSLTKSANASERVPPIGKRIYIIEEDGSAKVVAPSAQKNSQPVLKDPTLEKNKINFAKDKIQQPAQYLKPSAKAQKAIVKKSEVPRKHNNTLSFKKSRITGSLREPRVKFARNELSVGRRDEPIKRDFFQKVFEDLNDFEN